MTKPFMAIDETHLKTVFFRWVQEKLKKYTKIIYIKEE